EVGNDLRDDVHPSAERSQKEDDVEPIAFRPAPDEVYQGDALDNESPGIKQVAEKPHGRLLVRAIEEWGKGVVRSKASSHAVPYAAVGPRAATPANREC